MAKTGGETKTKEVKVKTKAKAKDAQAAVAVDATAGGVKKGKGKRKHKPEFKLIRKASIHAAGVSMADDAVDLLNEMAAAMVDTLSREASAMRDGRVTVSESDIRIAIDNRFGDSPHHTHIVAEMDRVLA